MEPVTTIVTALVAAASAASKDVATTAIKDAYQGFKQLVIAYWKRKEPDQERARDAEIEAKFVLKKLDEHPDNASLLKDELTKLSQQPDPELLTKAQELIDLVKQACDDKVGYQFNISTGEIKAEKGSVAAAVINKSTITINNI